MILLLVHAAATLFMFGVILTVQCVHYPLFSIVGDLRFPSYHKAHMRRIGRVVILPMIVELGTAVALIIWPPDVAPAWMLWLGFVLLLSIWISTWFIQVPRHTDLTKGFDSVAHARLVSSNWIRTGAWGLRSILVISVLHLVVTSTT